MDECLSELENRDDDDDEIGKLTKEEENYFSVPFSSSALHSLLSVSE